MTIMNPTKRMFNYALLTVSAIVLACTLFSVLAAS